MQITKYVESKCLSIIILSKYILNLQFSYSLLSSNLRFANRKIMKTNSVRTTAMQNLRQV